MLEKRIRVRFDFHGEQVEGDLLSIQPMGNRRGTFTPMGVISVEGHPLMIRKLTELYEAKEKEPDVEQAWRDLLERTGRKPDAPDIPHWGGPVRPCHCQADDSSVYEAEGAGVGYAIPSTDAIRGFRPDLIVCDDIAHDEALEEIHRQRACEAYQASDQMVCKPCGLTWDVNDSDPPHCQRLTRIDPIIV